MDRFLYKEIAMNFRASCLLVIATTLSTTAVAVAEPWSLGTCNPAGQANWNAFEQTVRKAKPGSVYYVPKPFPTTDNDVIADYLSQYKSLHREALPTSALPANEKTVLDGILGSTVSFAVKRVENWTPMRCALDKKRDFYYLVQVFDAASGQELTRVVLDNSGLFFLISNNNTNDRAAQRDTNLHKRAPLPEVQQAMAEANAQFGIVGQSPELVTTFGTIDCYFAEPCLAFRLGLEAYVLFKGDLYAVPASGKRLVQGKDVGLPRQNELLQSSLQPTERYLSLGGPTWTVAHKVDAKSLRGHRSGGT
jgi:hypothetical protein